MSLFLLPHEREFIKSTYVNGVTARLYWNTLNRVNRRAESPGLQNGSDTVEWWHMVDEAVSDAAMLHALQPSALLATWLRSTVLSLVRRTEDDWVGPWFRNHSHKPAHAELETAHVTRAVAVAFDLAHEVFTPAEQQEIRAILLERAIPMAVRHLQGAPGFHNHRCIVASGLAVAAAVTNDSEGIRFACEQFEFYLQAYQLDGTYAETLQYGNYATLNMVLAYEALVRREPALSTKLDAGRYAGFATWAAYCHLYLKPLAGWGQEPIPRAVNFGDSAATFVPSAEVLLHIASRSRKSHPQHAAVARWLFDSVIDTAAQPTPHDRASFGFVNRPGFLTMPLLASAADAASPEQLKLPELGTFSCGDTIARDAWIGRTVLAVRAGGDAMNVASHLHGDLNSVILVHNRERLLVDPGHSCYRNLHHELECSTATHSTCTFTRADDPYPAVAVQQRRIMNRRTIDGVLEGPLDRGVDRLLVADDGDVRVTVSDAARAYGSAAGNPIERFVRICILCGTHAVFVADHITSSVPVITRWNWLLNNRDGRSEFKPLPPDRIIFRRGDAGMKLFNLSGHALGGPEHAFVHDAYHPLPGQLGEGHAGSGILMHWRERSAALERSALHAIALDDTGRIASWHLKNTPTMTTLSGHNGATEWSLDSSGASASGIAYRIISSAPRRAWSLAASPAGVWSLQRETD